MDKASMERLQKSRAIAGSSSDPGAGGVQGKCKITLSVDLLLNLIVRASIDGGRDERSQNSPTGAARRGEAKIRSGPAGGPGRRLRDPVPGRRPADLS